VTVDDMQLLDCNDCECDYVAFAYDQSFNETTAKICKQSDVSFIRFHGHRIFVKFETFNSRTVKGFKISYKAVDSSCGGLFTATSGSVSTPNYPRQNYENDQNCEWNIKTDSAHTIIFQLLGFDLEESVNCSKDKLEIHDPIFKELLWSGCGNQLPNQTIFNSKRNKLTIQLKSDNKTTAKGFKGSFTRSCGGRIIVEDSGNIRYSEKSPPKTPCVWSIVAADPTQKVLLTFTKVSETIKINDTSCLSYLKIHEGDSVEGPIRAKICSHGLILPVYSNGNALTIEGNFGETDNYGKEFSAHYTVLENGGFQCLFVLVLANTLLLSACGATYTHSFYGTFASPNYPESSPLNINCIWTVTGSPGNKFSLSINELDIVE
jgi:cubilin